MGYTMEALTNNAMLHGIPHGALPWISHRLNTPMGFAYRTLHEISRGGIYVDGACHGKHHALSASMSFPLAQIL